MKTQLKKINKKKKMKFASGTLLVKKYFENLGYNVLNPKHMNSNGADINIIKNNEVYRIEIKDIRKTKGNSYRSEPICENRRNDDFVVLVYKNNIIDILSMKDHLSLCSESGIRIITNKINLLRLT